MDEVVASVFALANFGKLGLYATQVLLAMLLLNRPVSVGELSILTMLTESTICNHLRQMEKQGITVLNPNLGGYTVDTERIKWLGKPFRRQ